MNFTFHLIFLLALLLLSAFFSAAETAIFSLSKLDRRRMKETHPGLASWVFFHLDQPAQSLSTILILNLVVNVLATATVTTTSLHFFGPKMTGWAVALFTAFLIIFSEITPKVIAVRKNQWVALFSAVPLRVGSVMIFPLRKIARWVTDWILSHVIHEKKEAGDHLSSGELKALVKIGEEEGVLDSQERHMIQKTIELGERPVKDIMTPRVDVKGLDLEDPFERHGALMKQFHHTHFLVYKTSLDNILGTVSVQDYMLDEKSSLLSLLKDVYFVPETKRIDDLLTEFRNKKIFLAVCVDEYGGTAGLVTLEDILEEIFGEFYDEYAQVQNPVKPHGPHEYLVETKISLADFNERFSTKLESVEVSTLGGFILEKLGEVPQIGKVLKLPECELIIHEVIRQRYVRSVIAKFP